MAFICNIPESRILGLLSIRRTFRFVHSKTYAAVCGGSTKNGKVVALFCMECRGSDYHLEQYSSLTVLAILHAEYRDGFNN